MGLHAQQTATILPFVRQREAQNDFAGMAHLLRQAHSTAATANVIARRRRQVHPITGTKVNRVQLEALEQIVASTGEAREATKRALEDVATIPPRMWARAQGLPERKKGQT